MVKIEKKWSMMRLNPAKLIFQTLYFLLEWDFYTRSLKGVGFGSLGGVGYWR